MTILVTGGAGYIGSHMVHTLVESGESVVVLDNLAQARHAAELIKAKTGHRDSAEGRVDPTGPARSAARWQAPA
jgi:UDP-glucose 4-epimerase